MGRAKDPSPREHLLSRASHHVLAHGLPELSLRGLADAIGTTARMLVYHFGSKEALIAAVLSRAFEQHQQALHASATTPETSAATALSRFWRDLSHPDARPLLRLLYEVDVLSLHNPTYATFSREAFAHWRAVVTALLTPRHGSEKAEVLATLVVGTVSGLLLDLIVTEQAERVDAAFHVFLARLDQEDPAA